MRVDRLALHNFRGVRNLTLEPRPNLTVLVGVNGAGKTTFLDALALALSELSRQLPRHEGARKEVRPHDFHKEESELSVETTVELGGERCSWSVAATRVLSEIEEAPPDEVVQNVARRLVNQLKQDASTHVPLAVYFPVNRAVLDIPDRIRTPHVFDQFGALENALSDNWNNFRIFFEWFRDQEDYENERRIGDTQFRDPQLEAVRSAVQSLLEGFHNLRIERQPLRMVVEKGQEKLAINQLSDGEKCLLALAGDLARRLALANPASPKPLLNPAVVLIDEIELHLHPRWQRRVIPELQKTFPKCQFIITTHSPQVLSEVAPADILLLMRDNGEIQLKGVQNSYGRSSNWILEAIMDVSERPQDVKDWIERCFALIDADRFDEARQELKKMGEQLGLDDPDLVRAEILLRRKEMLKRATR
jgi:predicted ATP-binding protein involved in virulence